MFDRQTLWALMLLSLRNPREGATAVLATPLPTQALWLVLVLCAILSTILTWILAALIAMQQPEALSLLSSPVASAAFQFGSSVVFVFAIQYVGALFGGRGVFAESLQITAWLHIILVAFSGAQLVLFPIFSSATVLLQVLAVIAMLYLITGFIQAVHGFRSGGKVFGGIIGCLFGLGVLLSILFPGSFTPDALP